jgi:hypothetical protein
VMPGTVDSRGLYFGPKMIIVPPPLLKIFFPPLATRRFSTPIVVFCLTFSIFCIYFTLLLPYFSFSFPFLSFSFFFFPLSFFFFYIFPFFLFAFSYIFAQMTSANISPPPWGGGIFQNIDPWWILEEGLKS